MQYRRGGIQEVTFVSPSKKGQRGRAVQTQRGPSRDGKSRKLGRH